MKTFRDNENREWLVSVNVATVKRCRDLAGVDLMGAVGGDTIQRLIGDPVLLCDAIYAVCKPEADARGITDEEFGRGLGGDSIEAATTALLEDLVDFFPMAKRNLLRKALTKMYEMTTLSIRMAGQKIDALNPEEIAERYAASGELSIGSSE